MYEVPLTQPPQDIYYTKPSKWYRLFMIGMHCVNTWIIYMLWGWCPALIFAVHPLSAWGVAWVTGNYYATTAYFCLISYYIIHSFPNIWGAMVAMPIFAAALNSTICCVTFPFLFFLMGNPWGCYLFIPLAVCLGGNRFLTGIKIRDSFKENKPMKMDFTYKRLFLMTKIMAQYTVDFLFPNKLGLFPAYGNKVNDDQEVYDQWQACNKDFWLSLCILVSVFTLGMFVSKIGTLWYFTNNCNPFAMENDRTILCTTLSLSCNGWAVRGCWRSYSIASDIGGDCSHSFSIQNVFVFSNVPKY